MSGPYNPRRNDPETSREWAERMNVNYGPQWAVIEEDIVVFGASTYREVATRTGIDGTVTSTSMTKMETAGILRKLVDSDGKLVKRKASMLREVIPIPHRGCPADENGQGVLF